MKKEKKTILICSNYAWTVYKFRMALIRVLRDKGFAVYVLTEFDDYVTKIENEVDGIYPLKINRAGTNPIQDIQTFLSIFKVLLDLNPSLLLSFTIKPVIYGGLATQLLGIPFIPNISGLGSTFIKSTILTDFVKFLYRIALDNVFRVFFQNRDDEELFIKSGIVNGKKSLRVPGSGINLEEFKVGVNKSTQKKKFTFLLFARMLWDKGINEYVESCRNLKLIYPHIECQLLGFLDNQNPTSIPKEQIEIWENDLIVQYMGDTDDVRPFIQEADCIVLPSYREGTPRSLLEAAAMGKPIITSNVPGCREIVEENLNGYLCFPRDVLDLTDKMLRMIELDAITLNEMGRRSRQKVEKEFDEKIVIDRYLGIIGQLF